MVKLRPADLLDADDLEWAGSITPERRDRSLFQAKLLVGALWEASAVLIEQLFEDLDGLREDRPEEDCALDRLLVLGSGAAFYEYDFGGSWLHRLELISSRPANADTPPARLIDGARRGPLEDSGGLPGYEAIMDALANPSHPDHAEYSAWVAETTGLGGWRGAHSRVSGLVQDLYISIGRK